MKPYYQDSHCTIYHGCSKQILKQMADESVDIVWTDPPYGHANHDGDLNSRLNDHRGLINQPIANDTQEEFRETLDAVLVESARILKRDCCCCCCCCCGGGGPSPTFAWVAQRMDSFGLSFFHSVIWNKLNPGLGWRFRRQHEMVMVAHRIGGKLKWAKDDLAVPNIFECSPPRNRRHPNEKPIALPLAFLSWHGKQGDLVVDPFMGSGTTLVAAKALGMRCIGIELDERHCAEAAKRLQQEYLPLVVETKPKLEEQALL